MVHLPKIASWHGVLVPPRQVPVGFTLGALAGTLLLALAAAAGLSSLGSVSARSQDYTQVVTQVMRYINEWHPEHDPLITLPGGAQAKASNIYGIDVGGVRYFYQLTHGSSFDPLRVGTAGGYEVVAVIDAGTPWEVLIYRLR